jgi:hypothetical protein
LWGIVNAHNGAFASLAHPQSGDYTNLETGSYSAAADNAISGCAMRSGSAFSTTTDYSDAPATLYETYYRTILGKGYHVGPSIDHDNHNTTFGRTLPGRTVVLANSLTKADILSALRASRYYASDDWNVQVDYNINGLYMGAVSDITANPTITGTITDPDNESVSKIQLYYGVPGSNNQATILTTVNNSNTITYTHSITVGNTYYYFLKITQQDGDIIWTAPIWVHKINAPLALELTDFTLTPAKTSIGLEWKGLVTGDGLFVVERSVDGIRYEIIGEVPGPQSTETQTFRFDDKQPVRGLAFYRLHFLGTYDGTDSYSAILSAVWDHPDLTITVGPNPVLEDIYLRYNSETDDSQYWYFLYDEDGREIIRQAIAISKGDNELSIDAHALPAGLYYLILGKPGVRVLETKFVKM